MCNDRIFIKGGFHIYKISKFAYLCGTTAKTIRFYDIVGVLKADYIDSSNGYRYYNEDKLLEYYKIVSLKHIGFTIDEIHDNFMNSDDSEILNILKTKAKVLSEAYENCKKVISVYEERVKMYNGAKNARVKINCDNEKHIVYLDDGIKSTAVYCTAEKLFDCYNVLNEIFNTDGLIQIDLQDLCNINTTHKVVTMGYGYYTGVNKGEESAKKAIVELGNVNSLLISIETSKDLTLAQINSAVDYITGNISEDATIIWGASFSDEITDSIAVTVIGFI